MIIANVVFFLGTLVCALAISVGMLLAGRAIQGIGGAGLLTLVSIAVGDLFSLRYVHMNTPLLQNTSDLMLATE